MARKNLHTLSVVSWWKRKSAKILIVASIFSQKVSRARFFAGAKEAFLRLYFCVKFEEPTIFLGIPSSQKCHRKASLVLRRTEMRSLLLFCEKCEVPKILEFVVAIFNSCGFYK
jgi:hypothetical protein